jgi:hypothetical protein
MEDIKLNVATKLGRFQKKPSIGASHNGRIDGASAFVHARAQES